MGDTDVSEMSESSYADARADTPTIGEHKSNSEDTLSNLSLDDLEDLEHPVRLEGGEANEGISSSSSFASALNGSLRVVVTDADIAMTDSQSLDLPLGIQYIPTSVDFAKSPSQLKLLKGPLYMPKEEAGVASEDENSYQAKVDLNGQVRWTKKKDVKTKPAAAAFIIPSIHFPELSTEESFRSHAHSQEDPDADALDDYIEDFILPLSHESVMSRQLSFRKKVKRTYEEVAAEKAAQELAKFDTMLSTYEEEDENNRSLSPQSSPHPHHPPPYPKEPQSILDIDAIVSENAPNLMRLRPNNSEPSLSNFHELESLSNYFLPQQTLEKLSAVYESSNFNNIYCLSGEIKNILSPSEIEEILENKEQLERVLDPTVLAALHWSLSPSSLAEAPTSSSVDVDAQGLKSKSSSMSNGFHSDASSEDSDSTSGKTGGDIESGIESPTTSPTPNQQAHAPLQRGAPLTASMRRRIEVCKELKRGPDEEEEDGLDEIDLGVGDDDWEEERGGGGGTTESSLVRKDSKRFSFKGKDGRIERVVEGVFVESRNSNPMGTLRKLKAPLNLAHDEDELSASSSPEPGHTTLPQGEDEGNSQRRKLSVDENILSMVSSTEAELDEQPSQATLPSQSDVFYSIKNSKDEEDPTVLTEAWEEEEEDVTLDIDTPDDMEDSIIGQLESVCGEVGGGGGGLEESMRWKSYRVGPSELQIDLQAIQPYRKCLSHGGYFDAEKSIGIILFSGCFLPDRSQPNYTYLMDHLFLYVLSTLEELIVEDYILVYLHGATPKSCMPSYGWLKKCYHLINHRLRKNLKGLYLVHPTFWLRTVVTLTRPFVSSKFSRKLRFMNTLSDLCLEIPTEHLVIPDSVLQYDFDLKVEDLKKRKLLS